MRRLLVFLKYPSPGRVKTRLAAQLGDEASARVSRTCAELTLQRMSPFQRASVVYVDPPEAIEQTRAWLGPEWALRPQRGELLGARLQQAVKEAFAEGAKRVAVIGTDAPWLKSQDIREAWARLGGADLVLGPTEDGGYYLIGLSRQAPQLFDAVAWSTSRVYAQTLAKASAMGLRVRTLPLGYDIDYLDDLRKFLEEERATGTRSPHVDALSRLITPVSTLVEGGHDA